MTYFEFLDPDECGSISCQKNKNLDIGSKKMWNHKDPNPDPQPCCQRISSNKYCHIIGLLPPDITLEWQIKEPLYQLLLFVSELLAPHGAQAVIAFRYYPPLPFPSLLLLLLYFPNILLKPLKTNH